MFARRARAGLRPVGQVPATQCERGGWFASARRHASCRFVHRMNWDHDRKVASRSGMFCAGPFQAASSGPNRTSDFHRMWLSRRTVAAVGGAAVVAHGMHRRGDRREDRRDSDAGLLAITVVRHLLGRRSAAGFLAEVARDWGDLFPHLPCQSEANRRIRWLWGASGQLRAMLASRLPEDDCQQIDTSAVPVKHTSRVRGAGQQTSPGNDLAARFGRDAAHAEWFYGFPAGHQDRPGQPGGPGVEHRARRGQRARGRHRPAGRRAGPS